MKIDLHIERLLLDGPLLSGASAHALEGDALRAALGAELTRLLQQAPSQPARSAALPFARAAMPAPDAARGAAASLGAGVAQALYGITHGGAGGGR